MHRPAFVRLVLGVGMLAILVLTLTACGGGGSAQEKKGGQANKVHTLPEDAQTYEGEPLPAGRYVTEEFKAAMSLTLSNGWSRGGPEQRDTWYIWEIENDAFWLGFYSGEEVYVPDGSGGLKVVSTPEDVVGWLQENPYRKTDKPKPTSVGDEKGAQFDAIVTGAPKVPECLECGARPLPRKL